MTLNTSAREKLFQIVSGIESLNDEKNEIRDAIKDKYSEAKAQGYDTKALRQIIRLRAQDRQKREELEHIISTYMLALESKVDGA